MTLLFHLLRALFRAFFRITLTALVCAAVAGGATLLVSYQQTHQWPPKSLTEVAAVAFAVLGAYAGGLTMLVKEAVKGVATVEKGAVKGVEEEVSGIEHEVAGKR